VASLTTVGSGGVEYVFAGGTAIGTTVSSGGTEYVYISGLAIGTSVDSGGYEVLSAGVASLTSVNIGGAIDDAELAYASGGSATVNSATDVLSVTVGVNNYTQPLAGDYTGTFFRLTSGSFGGTQLTLSNAPCYCRGTHILTDRGEIAVEDLRIGERVRTMLGETLAPIIWIGHREVDCARHPNPRKVWPVRIAAGAFGPGRPHSDLFLSPDHAVYVGEVLIPIRYLINASTIAQVPMERVTYYHIELPRHDVVLAQGLPAESFLDMRDGSNYANRPGPVRLYPDYSVRMWEAFGCARLIVTGPELAAARALVARFATDRAAA
jgi:autotransporter passenger strand-loop-strand repeat protein